MPAWVPVPCSLDSEHKLCSLQGRIFYGQGGQSQVWPEYLTGLEAFNLDQERPDFYRCLLQT